MPIGCDPCVSCPPPLPQGAGRDPARDVVWGILLGVVSVLAWAVYNVGSDLGEMDGFRPIDLVFFRYVFGGLFLLPVLWVARKSMPRLGQIVIMCLLVGPLFGFLVATGFKYSPLTHAVVFPPTASILTATTLVFVVQKERISLQRLCGIAILLLGLVLLAVDVPEPGVVSSNAWIGDLCFLVSGTMWGSYTFLVGYWRLSASAVAASIAVFSGLAVAPVYFIYFGATDRSAALVAEQIFYQGVMGGSLSFLAFAATVSRLGAGRAALFFATVPSSATLMAIPMIGVFPTPIQLVSVLLATFGIIISLEIGKALRWPRH